MESALKEEIEKYSPKERDLLTADRGLSKKIINRFLAEIENIKRFSSAKSLIRMQALTL